MRLIGLTLRSRPVFILLYCVFLYFLAATVVDAFSNSVRVSIPNLIRGVAPPLVIGSLFFSYWFYMTHVVDTNFSRFGGRPRISVKLLLYLVGSCSLLAILVVITGLFFSTTAGMMTALIYVVGLIGVAILAAIRPHLGICALIITMPIAFLLRMNLASEGVYLSYKYVVINPDILLLTVVAVVMLAGILVSKSEFVRTKLDLPIIAFILGSVIGLIYSSNFELSSRVLFVGTVAPVIAYYVIVNGVKTREELRLVGLSLVFSLFLMGLYSLLVFQRDVPLSVLLSGQERLSAFFTNLGLFALILTLVIPFTLSLTASSAMSSRIKIATGLTFVVLLTTLVFTFTRGAWAGFAVSMMISLLLSRDVRHLLLKMSPVLVIAVLLWGSVFSQIFWARTESLQQIATSSSWTDRIATLEAGWRMATDNYLTGVGPGMFRFEFSKYETGNVASYEFGADSHNLILTVWAETGALAAGGISAAFAAALWLAYRTFRRAKDPLVKAVSLGLLSGLAAFLVGTFAHGSELTAFTIASRNFAAGHTTYLFIFMGLIAAAHRISLDEQT